MYLCKRLFAKSGSPRCGVLPEKFLKLPNVAPFPADDADGL
jgi:hypothetical protein